MNMTVLISNISKLPVHDKPLAYQLLLNIRHADVKRDSNAFR